METLSTYFQSAGFDHINLEKILAAFQPKEFRKDDYFLEAGQKSRYLGFIEKGLFQYFVLVDGEEISTYVATENSFLASLLSFLQEVPSREYIRAISPARLWLIDKPRLIQLREEVPDFKDFYIRLLEWQIGCIDKSRLELLTLSAEQRYEKLLQEEPHLLQQIPLQYLASILGVTPRHLSRLRKNIR
jgi:CRP/FNR family transcriptional regulator, anaerobic regulatory protein